MANLGNLIVRGVTRILGDAYANKFIGNLQGNADTATSAIKASTADSATSATSANKALIATAVQDYGTSDYREIKIGYNGSGLSSSTITHAVGFTDGGTKIKDISKDEFRNWLATASGTWNISILGNAATATNAENISSIYPQLAASLEADEINVKRKIDWNNWGDYGYQLETAIDFNWYETHNLFGVIRGSGADSAGFGWMYSPDGSTYTPIARLSPSGHAKVNSLKTQYICIECDNSGNTAGRSSEINNYAGPLYIQYNTSNDCFICSGGGNVGIGTVSPSSKLHVVGDIYTTTGFKKEGSSDSYVLLGGGGHKLISDFSIAHSHPYLPLSGGTLTGSVMMSGMDTNLIRNITAAGTSGWARDLIALQVDGVRKFSVAAHGDYTAGASSNGIYYGYIGCNSYDGLNLRISATSLSWGDNSILHLGNYNSYALPISGGTLTGNIEWQTDSHGIYLYRGCGIEKWSGYGPTLVAEGDNTNFWIRNGEDRDIRYLILHTGNYTSYTVKKDGTGATGTWGINISGNAATATNAENATNSNAVNGVSFTWDGEITSSQWIAAWESGTSIRTMSAYNTFISMCSYLDEGSSDVTDGTMFITSYATDNGFADPNGKNKPYKRKASLLWNYINNKCSSIYATQEWVRGEEYLYRSGGTMDDNAQIKRNGESSMWIYGRDNALIRETSSTGYHPLFSLKTADGSWELGEYNLSGWYNIPVFSYITDENYNNGNNSATYQIQYPLASGTIALTADLTWSKITDKPSVNNGVLNLQASGATKVTFYANQSDTSNFNITTGSANGTISVAGTDVAVKGLGSNAYNSTVYLPLAGGTMDARAEIGITTKLFIGNSTSPDTCYTKFNCILHGGGDESNPNWIIHDNGYSEFKSSVSANAFYASSDIRLKNILDDINIDFDKLKLIPKKYYTWKGSDILQLGTIAQDIQKIYPEVVSKNENGYLSVDYSKLSIIALAAIDKLNERIKELECQIKL